MLALHAEAQGQKGTRQVPKLVVNITIDQLRSDYLELFAPTFGTDGFLRLMEQGVVFEKTIDALSHAADWVTLLLPLWSKAQMHAHIRDED